MSNLYTNNTALQTGLTVSLSILVVTDLIGNSLVILIILTNKSMKSPMNYLLVNLAVADMMAGLFLAPRFIFSHFFIHPDGLTGNLLCTFLTGANLAWVGGVASSSSLVAVSFERFFAVLYPLSSKLHLTVKKVKVIVAVCWIFSVLLNLPLFLTKTYDENLKICTGLWPEDQQWLEGTYFIFWSIIVGAVPIAIIVVLYSRVIYTLWFKRSEHQVQGTQLAMLKSRKRLTKMMLIVTVIYAICSLPDFIIHVIIFSGIQNNYVTAIHNGCIVLMTCNSAVNPFIYTLNSRRFRIHLKKLFGCKKVGENRLSIAHSRTETIRTSEVVGCGKPYRPEAGFLRKGQQNSFL